MLGHSSDQHPWFQESRQSQTNAKADWYVWADPKSDGTPPNNWLSPFGGSAWAWESQRSQYYFHNFLESQPDLNLHHPDVREAQLNNVRFWLDLGVDGVRLDSVGFYFHDQRLRDNPSKGGCRTNQGGLAPNSPYGYQRHDHDSGQPEVSAFLRELRTVLDEYSGRTSLGEVSVADDAIGSMAEYTSDNDKLHMAYTFEPLGRVDDTRPYPLGDRGGGVAHR